MPKRPKPTNRRFSIGIAFVLDARLSIFSRAFGRSRANLCEEFVADRLTECGDWREVQKLITQESILRGIPLEDILREQLEKDGFSDQIDLSEVDLRILFDDFYPTELEDSD